MRRALANSRDPVRYIVVVIVAPVAILERTIVMERACPAVGVWYKRVGCGKGGPVEMGGRRPTEFY
jgi:hypothetical protein